MTLDTPLYYWQWTYLNALQEDWHDQPPSLPPHSLPLLASKAVLLARADGAAQVAAPDTAAAGEAIGVYRSRAAAV
jgi:hypothetical protein